jgi:inorganic phosphate transporter, PiT family
MLQTILFFTTIGFGYIYAFVTGFGDASNSIATTIGSRAMKPRLALTIASVMEFFGAISGVAVALTITTGVIRLENVRVSTVLAALIGVVVWSGVTYLFGIPVSETHGLIGSIIGAGIAIGGFGIVLYSRLYWTIGAVLLSPILGFLVGLIAMKIVSILFHRSRQDTSKKLFTRLQYLSSSFVAFSHGHNDAQKPMGIIAMVLAIHYEISNPTVPFWVVVSVAAVESLGVALGGVRILKTLGLKLTKLRVDQAFVSQSSAAVVLELASFFGVPISTTQTITSSIIGSGVAVRKNSIRWGLVQEILMSWLITLPATVVIGFGVMKLFLYLGI